MSPAAVETPQQAIARVAAAATRYASPCGDGTMVMHSWGSGPPLVLLHGNYGSWTHWIRNVEALSRHFRVIAVDIPGFGDSAVPPEPYSIHSVAAIIAEGVLGLAGEAKVHLAGFSFGAAAASETAHVLGTRLAQLVLVSAGRNMTGITMAPVEGIVKWRGLDTVAERDAAHRRNLNAVMIADGARIDELSLAIQHANAERTRLKRAVVTRDAATQTRVPSLAVPVSFIWGERDANIGSHMADRLQWIRQFRPGARHALIPGAGHWVSYEQPEAFNAALLDLLRQTGAA
jgi:pimeloyl-ACP methyl ester carboxylesterase